MRPLASGVLSTESLCRGARILRGQTMSMEHDDEYAELLAERERILVACLFIIFPKCGVIVRVSNPNPKPSPEALKRASEGKPTLPPASWHSSQTGSQVDSAVPSLPATQARDVHASLYPRLLLLTQ